MLDKSAIVMRKNKNKNENVYTIIIDSATIKKIVFLKYLESVENNEKEQILNKNNFTPIKNKLQIE
jgi:hypothetical protein